MATIFGEEDSSSDEDGDEDNEDPEMTDASAQEVLMAKHVNVLMDAIQKKLDEMPQTTKKKLEPFDEAKPLDGIDGKFLGPGEGTDMCPYNIDLGFNDMDNTLAFISVYGEIEAIVLGCKAGVDPMLLKQIVAIGGGQTVAWEGVCRGVLKGRRPGTDPQFALELALKDCSGGGVQPRQGCPVCSGQGLYGVESMPKCPIGA